MILLPRSGCVAVSSPGEQSAGMVQPERNCRGGQGCLRPTQRDIVLRRTIWVLSWPGSGCSERWSREEIGCDLPPEDTAWRMGEVDLSPWRGQAIPIRFRLHADGEYNTWVYIDDISVQ